MSSPTLDHSLDQDCPIINPAWHYSNPRYNLSSVTLDGTMSRRGTVTGGYQGGGGAQASPSEQLLRQKAELAMLQVRLQCCR